MPPGVFNVVPADESNSIAVGKTLCESDVVRKLSFTGSTAVGRILMQQSAPTLKKLSLELGGNAPFIVFDDAAVDAAVEGAVVSKYRNAGQTCVCTNRFYVHEKVYDEFVQKLAAKAAQLKVGSGFEAGVQQGPLIDANALKKVEQHVADATKHGASVVTGGERHALGGTFYQPTVLADVTDKMLLTREETFGPVAPVFRFSRDDQAIAAANASEFGLAAYFYSRDVARVSCRRSARIRHGRGQHRADVERSLAVRWHQAVGVRTRRVEVRYRGVPRHQIRVHREVSSPRIFLVQQQLARAQARRAGFR